MSVVLGLGTRSSVSDERSGLKSDSERKASVGLAVLTGTRKRTVENGRSQTPFPVGKRETGNVHSYVQPWKFLLTVKGSATWETRFSSVRSHLDPIGVLPFRHDSLDPCPYRFDSSQTRIQTG